MREGLVSANNHLRMLTPHVDADGELSIVTEPMMQPVETTGFSCTNSFGNSGTYVTAIAWADRMELFVEKPAEGPRPAPFLLFWPSSKELDEELKTEKGFFLAGSFSWLIDGRPFQLEALSDGSLVEVPNRDRGEP